MTVLTHDEAAKAFNIMKKSVRPSDFDRLFNNKRLGFRMVKWYGMYDHAFKKACAALKKAGIKFTTTRSAYLHHVDDCIVIRVPMEFDVMEARGLKPRAPARPRKEVAYEIMEDALRNRNLSERAARDVIKALR